MSEGRKYDGDKSPVVQGFMHYFPRAIQAVALVSKYGAEKYKTTFVEENWAKVDDGLKRYTDADGRHLIDEAIDGPYDPESDLLHAAHHAWDAMARLEKMLRAGVAMRRPAEASRQGTPFVSGFVSGLRLRESQSSKRRHEDA